MKIVRVLSLTTGCVLAGALFAKLGVNCWESGVIELLVMLWLGFAYLTVSTLFGK